MVLVRQESIGMLEELHELEPLGCGDVDSLAEDFARTAAIIRGRKSMGDIITGSRITTS